MNKRILICDDDEDILKSINLLLLSSGYDTSLAMDGLEALEKLITDDPDLILLDVMMPKLDGISTLLKIRRENNIPIIMLSAKAEIEDKVTGLNAGADDYISKPYNSFELLARVNSHLRRNLEFNDKEESRNESYDIMFKNGGLEINDLTKEVFIDEKKVNLTKNEYGILLYLIKNKGIVFTSNQIYEAVWKEEAFDIKKIISLHINHLREKIEINPKNPDYLISIYGMGYKMEVKK